jgi:hypothetical protein
MEDQILELKFEGKQMNPSLVHPTEIAELIGGFTDSLLSTIKQEHPEIDTAQLLFTFYNVDDKSLDLKFKMHRAQDLILASYSLIAVSITQSNYSKLNSDAIDGLKTITKFAKKHDCIGSLRHNTSTLTQFTPNTEVRVEKENEVRGETVIYGKILRVGGETPTIHFKVNNEYRIVFDTKEEVAKKMGKLLYEDVRLSGIAKWDAKSYKVIDFTAHEVYQTEDKPISETFNELADLMGEYWDNVDNIHTIIE